ncbi:peptide chain release factor 1 [Roseomonas elaeocarpi]|uniref:Peptide chain release factor 1 n=1 Tax=Roseomonas elaeocarpi TaxID=907779 RepID=A0ABV6JUN1_9PROT
MTESEFEARLKELDRLINDPEVRMDPERVWSLLAEVSAGPSATPVLPAVTVPSAGLRLGH